MILTLLYGEAVNKQVNMVSGFGRGQHNNDEKETAKSQSMGEGGEGWARTGKGSLQRLLWQGHGEQRLKEGRGKPCGI